MNGADTTLDQAADANLDARVAIHNPKFADNAKFRRLKEQLFFVVILTSTLMALAFLFYLLYSVFSQGSGRLDMEFFTNFPSRRPASAGFKSAIWGT
ncbi:MAG: hypothetical protein EOP10_25835, partial [Proteobacteria bacterium]